EAEYEYAATFGGTRQFPWGNSSDAGAGWEFGPCGTPASDCLPTTPPVYGLFSNVAEWTCSWFVPYRGQQHHVPLEEAAHQRVVRGGSPSVIHGRPDSTDGSDGPRVRIGVTASTSFAGVGFRCARSAHPRL